MYSWELITNLHTKKVLCHHAEVAKGFKYCTIDYVFCNVICRGKFLSRKYSTLMKPKGSAKRHQTLSSWVGSGHETTPEEAWQGHMCHVLMNVSHGWRETVNTMTVWPWSDPQGCWKCLASPSMFLSSKLTHTHTHTHTRAHAHTHMYAHTQWHIS